ncbi:MAG TPA: UDP-N-acetylmuramate dehydrogenase [Cellulomonas sp.]
MEVQSTTFADLTTIGVGGPTGAFVETATEADLVDAVRTADAEGTPLLVIGGGSNLLVSDAGFDGLVLRDGRHELTTPDHSACAGVTVTVAAGTPWDDVVAHATSHRLYGIEALAGIPGSTGATPVQNVGAYGQEVSQTIATVRVWDRGRSRVRTLPLVDLEFGYRTSLLKRSTRALPDQVGPGTDPGAPWFPTPRYVVLDVTFQLRVAPLSEKIRYAELAAALGIAVGERAPLPAVREAVLALRSRKGMVLDPTDPDTRSAGSFFTNPVLTEAEAATLPQDAPRYPAGDGLVKTSAAWLIEQSDFGKGYGLPGPAALSTKHTLALTNRGGATAGDLLTLARTVRDGVHARFGIALEPEPVLVGTAL